ncbi:MAG: hypothetical protein U0270_38805 [Labilithrix sp.]
MSFSSWAVGAVFVGCIVVACSSDPPAGGDRAYCDVTKSASTKCTSPQSCDTTLTSQCGSVEKAVSPTALAASRDCLESGVCGASLCLTRALKSSKPTDAHADLATRYCTTCAPDVADCAAQFYQAKSKLPGVLVLPYSGAVAKAVADACTADAGACRANFSTCANDTIVTALNGFVSADLASCISGAFTNDEPATTPGGPTTSTSGGPQIQSCTADNCQGCCREDRCVEGKTEDACGRSGLACQTCSAVQKCTEEGQCHEPCGPNNCKGCCDGDNCIPGETTDKCGGAGEACTKCDADNPELVCADQKCIDGSCKATCTQGCCTATGCQPGTTAQACGINAGACVTCGYGKQCTNHACVLDTSSLWDVVVTGADIPAKKLNDSDWDPFYGAPDPFVKLYSNLGADSHTGQTAFQTDNLHPAWTTEVPLKGISAKELMNNLSFEIWDDDFDYDDQVGGCKIGISAANFSGVVQQVTCNQTPSLPSVTLRFKLVPHT